MPKDYGYYLACANMTLCFLASVGYTFSGNFRSALYWFAAFIITATVTIK